MYVNVKPMSELVLIIIMVFSLQAFSLSAAEQQPSIVNFCELVHHPDLYSGKIIRTQAILVENHTPRVDGSDPLLYDPACNGIEGLVFADLTELKAEGRSLLELADVKQKADKHGDTRVMVTLVGTFEHVKRYGHLDWAGAQVVAHVIEKAQEVPAKVEWPKGRNKSKG